MRRVASALVLFVVLAACSDEAKIGESCDKSGATAGQCVSGAVCGKDTSDSLICLKTCNVQSDCTADQECNGVEGSNLKACRLKTTSTGADAGKK
jgi:hypothetical protein